MVVVVAQQFGRFQVPRAMGFQLRETGSHRIKFDYI